MNSYEFLLNKIVDNVDNLEDKEYIADNIESIAESLKDFSLLFNKLISISINNKSYAEKIDEISNMTFNQKPIFDDLESNQILDALNLQGGNIDNTDDKQGIDKKNIENLKEIHKSVDKNIIFCFSNIGLIAMKLVTNFPKYGLLIISKFFSDLSQMYNFDWHSFNDFTKKLDWIFIMLFVLASIPYIGFFIDVVIIIRAVKQERFFLAIMTFITTIVSMFTLHTVDLGAILKFLYFIDVFSYTNRNNQLTIPTEGDEEVFFDNSEKYTTYIKDGSQIPVKKLEMAIDKVKENTIQNVDLSQSDKEENLNNLKKEVIVRDKTPDIVLDKESLSKYDRKSRNSDLIVIESPPNNNTSGIVDTQSNYSDFSDDDSKSLDNFLRNKNNKIRDSDVLSDTSEGDTQSLDKFKRK